MNNFADFILTLLKFLLFVLPLLALWYGCVLYTFFRYRFIRQEELAHVLAAAAESGAPLAPAMWAYVRDRPQNEWRLFWVVILMFFVLPGYYFYWRRHNFERKVEHLAGLLETGFPLHEALRAAHGVASREVTLAAAVGEATGQLAPALRLAPRWRLAPVWLETGPRLLYPLFVLFGIYVVFTFVFVFILPKYAAIFADFKIKLPFITDLLITFGLGFAKYSPLVLLAVLSLGILTAFMLLNSTFRWYCPGLGRLYRMHTQSRLLRMLAPLLGAGKPLPAALGILADSGYFRGTALYRLAQAQTRVEEGESLAESLRHVGLLPRSMAALVQAAERAHNLPWALAELGEAQAKRTVRVSQRFSMAVFPIAIVLVGACVAFVAFGMFLPLLTLIAEVGK
jgi:type II secretory pathway component PulF